MGWVGTMPSDVPLTGAHQDRETTTDELKRELAEAREQQAATAQILTAISSSPTDARRAFAEIAASAARLCDAYDAIRWLYLEDRGSARRGTGIYRISAAARI